MPLPTPRPFLSLESGPGQAAAHEPRAPGHHPPLIRLQEHAETFCFTTGMSWLTRIILASRTSVLWGNALGQQQSPLEGMNLGNALVKMVKGFKTGETCTPSPAYFLPSQNFAFSLPCCLPRNPYSFQQIMSINALCEWDLGLLGFSSEKPSCANEFGLWPTC